MFGYKLPLNIINWTLFSQVSRKGHLLLKLQKKKYSSFKSDSPTNDIYQILLGYCLMVYGDDDHYCVYNKKLKELERSCVCLISAIGTIYMNFEGVCSCGGKNNKEGR